MKKEHSSEPIQQFLNIEKRTDDGYRVLQCIKKMFTERALMEAAYSRKLQLHAKKWETIIHEGVTYSQMTHAALALVMEASKKAGLHAKMAENIEYDSIKSLDDLLCDFYTTEDEAVGEMNPNNRKLLLKNYQTPWLKQASVLEHNLKFLYSLENYSNDNCEVRYKSKINFLTALRNFKDQEKVQQEKIRHLASECAKVEEKGKARSKKILTSALDHLDFTNSNSVEGTYDYLKWLVKISCGKTDVKDEVNGFAKVSLASDSKNIDTSNNEDSLASDRSDIIASDVHRVVASGASPSKNEVEVQGPIEDLLVNIDVGGQNELSVDIEKSQTTVERSTETKADDGMNEYLEKYLNSAT